MKESRETNRVRISGADAPRTPISRSMCPSRSGRASLSGLGAKRSRTFGATSVTAATKGCAEPFYEPFAGANGKGSLKRGDVQMAGMRTEDCAHVTCKQMDPIAKFGGAGCRQHWPPRPARTSNGSPVVDRRRARVRLMAEELKPRRRAAPVTLPSASNASSAESRFMSTLSMEADYWICRIGHSVRDATNLCTGCAWRSPEWSAHLRLTTFRAKEILMRPSVTSERQRPYDPPCRRITWAWPRDGR